MEFERTDTQYPKHTRAKARQIGCFKIKGLPYTCVVFMDEKGVYFDAKGTILKKVRKARKMKYATEEERLDNGLCPKCERELVKSCHCGGNNWDKTSVCPNKKCGWKDSEGF